MRGAPVLGTLRWMTTVSQSPASRVAVIGGGIAGLSAAHRLLTVAPPETVRVTVLEAGSRLGGWVRSESFAGRPVDFGPDSLLVRTPWAAELCRELGIDAELVAPGAGAARLLVGGELKVLPSGILAGLPGGPLPFVRSGLLGPIGLLRAALDLVLPAWRAPEGDESIGSLVRRRLGNQVLNRVIDPLLGGVHAGRCDELSLAATAPQIAAAAKADRSLLRGLRKTAPAPAPGAKPRPVFMGPRDGMQRIADALVGAIDEAGGELQTGALVTAIEHGDGGRIRVVVDDAEPVEYDAVVLAVPARAAAALLRPHVPRSADILGDLQYASVAQVALAYRPDDLSQLPEGTGFLVPRGEDTLLTACTFLDQKWPERERVAGDPLAGATVIKCSVGRIDDPRFIDLTDEQIVRKVHEDLTRVLGFPAGATPLASRVFRAIRGLPQYTPGHLDRVTDLEGELISAFPRLVLAGAAYRGTSVPLCIRQGRDAADHVLHRVREVTTIPVQ